MIRVAGLILSIYSITQAFPNEHFDRVEVDMSSWDSGITLSVLKVSRIACSALCQSQSDCNAFTFDNGTCQIAPGTWMKNKSGPKTGVFLRRTKKQEQEHALLVWEPWEPCATCYFNDSRVQACQGVAKYGGNQSCEAGATSIEYRTCGRLCPKIQKVELQVNNQRGYSSILGSIKIKLCDSNNECCQTNGRANFAPSELVVYEAEKLGVCEDRFFEDAQAQNVRVLNSNLFVSLMADSVTIFFSNGETLFCTSSSSPMTVSYGSRNVNCV